MKANASDHISCREQRLDIEAFVEEMKKLMRWMKMMRKMRMKKKRTPKEVEAVKTSEE